MRRVVLLILAAMVLMCVMPFGAVAFKPPTSSSEASTTKTKSKAKTKQSTRATRRCSLCGKTKSLDGFGGESDICWNCYAEIIKGGTLEFNDSPMFNLRDMKRKLAINQYLVFCGNNGLVYSFNKDNRKYYIIYNCASVYGNAIDIKKGDKSDTDLVIITTDTKLHYDLLTNLLNESKFYTSGDMNHDAEIVVVNSLKTTADMLEGKVSWEENEAADQMLLDALDYYKTLGKGELFTKLVNKKLFEHANEFKKK